MSRASAIRIRPRSIAALSIASIIGIGAFCWPLIIPADNALGHSREAPWLFCLLLVLVLAIVFVELGEDGLDSKAVAMLGVLAAVGAAVRAMGAGTAGIETVFFLIILSGRVFGPGFGFCVGATTLFSSALLTGGVGPWLPYQMLGSAWVGMGAGLLPRVRGRAELVLVALYGAIAGLAYGLILNLSFWPFSLGSDTELSFQPGDAVLSNLRRVVAYSLATSLGWDIGRAITTALLILLTGPVLLATLRRAARRARFAT